MFLSRALPLVLALASACDAFVPVHLSPRHHGVETFSEPSDTSSDPFYDDEPLTVESQEVVPTTGETLVTNVLDLVPDMLGEVSESERAKLNEVLLKLEAMNPTENPTMSSLLNGVWELRYAAGYASEGAFPSPTR